MFVNKIFKTRRGALGAILGALVLLLVAVLVACPAANSGAGGIGYVCANGTPSSIRDATADGLTRCASCDTGYTLFNEVCLTAYAYVCEDGTASSLRDATTDGLSRCISCDHPLFFALMGNSDTVGTTCRTVAEVGGAVRIGLEAEFGVIEGDPTGLAAIDNTLYMVGLGNDVLYTLNIDDTDGTPDGRAIQVSVASVTQFGVGEGQPTGLAAIDNTLYMVGADTRVLYTLNIDDSDMTPDGRAIKVGNLPAGLGVGETFPFGLAAISNTLYMVGTTDFLYTLDTATGGATRVNNTIASQFGVSEDLPRDLAAIGTTLYMVGASHGVLYTLDTTTGGATRVSNTIASQFDVGEVNPRGLAAIGTTLYMVGAGTDALYALRYQ